MTAGGTASRVLAAAVLAAGPALAEDRIGETPPVTEEQRRIVQLCRGAILYEEESSRSNRVDLPPGFVESLHEQMNFVLGEILFARPTGDVGESGQRVKFLEQSMLRFGAALQEERERLADPEHRRALLLECQPRLWGYVKFHLDRLMAERARE